MASRSARIATQLLSALVPLAAAWIVWHPLLDNYFFADDFLHLFDLVTLPLGRFLTQVWGGHLYVVRNAVFASTYALFGPAPRPWFWTVLLTHLLNVLLLQQAIVRTTRDRLLACLGATLWGTCPILEGTLGWYAVYGQVVLTAIVLAVLASLATAARAATAPTLRRVGAWGVLLALGGACFGTGLGLAAAFPIAVVVALPLERRPSRAVGVLAGTAGVVLAVYAVLRRYPTALDARNEELLSPLAVLSAAPTVLALAGHLLGFGTAALLLAPFGVDGAYPDVGAVVAVALVVGVIAAGLAVAERTIRRVLLALSALVVVAYGTVAVGRATILESVHLPLAQSAAWPRYHYLPLALLTLVLSVALAALRAAGRVPRAVISAIAVVWLAARLVLVVVDPPAIDHHDAERLETEAALRGIRDAVAAAPPGTTVTIQNRPFAAARIPALFPGWAGVFVIHFPENTVDGRPVRFVAHEGDWTLAQRRGGRIAALVVR